MKSPFSIYFWMLGQDVRQGDLQRYGFSKEPHPRGVGTSLYRKDDVWLHSFGLRVDADNRSYIYDRRRDSFYHTEHQAPPNLLPPLTSLEGLQRCCMAQGWEALAPFCREYEEQIARWRGQRYRHSLAKWCPPLLRPYRKRIEILWGSADVKSPR